MNYRKIILLLVMLSLVVTPVYASTEPTTEWEKQVTVSRPTHAFSLSPTNDGGAIIAGRRTIGDSKDGILIKVDSSGAKEWEKVHTSTENDYYADAVQTIDGGYIAIGSRVTTDKEDEVLLVKTNSLGVIEWEETYGGTDDDYGTSVIQDSNGDIVWTGFREHGGDEKVYYGKTTASGEFVSTIFQLAPSLGYKIIEASTGGYVIVGSSFLSEELGAQMMILKLDEDLTKEWQSYHGFAGGEVAYDVIEDSDGNFVSVGWREKDLSTSLWLFKFSPSGETLGAVGNLNYDSWLGMGIIQAADGSYIISGKAYGEDFNAFIASSDLELNIEWVHEFDDQDIDLSGMIPTDDGGLLLGGTLDGDPDMPALLKTTSVSSPLGSAKIIVTDSTGSNLIGALVSGVIVPPGQGPLSDVTNNHGFAQFSGIYAGDYTFFVNADGYMSVQQDVSVSKDETTEITVALAEEHAQLTVSVMDEQGAPLEGAAVSAMTKIDVGIMGSTDASGEVLFDSVTPGTHSVQVSLDGYESVVKQIVCASGVVASETYTLQLTEGQEPEPVTDPETPDPVSVTINVSDESGALRGVVISSVSCPEGQDPISGTTSTSGDVDFTILPGDYDLQLSRTGYQTTTESITVNEPDTIDLIMTPESTESSDDETSSDDDSSSEGSSTDHGTGETEPVDDGETDTGETSTDEPTESGNYTMLYIGAFLVIAVIVGVVYYLKSKGSL